MPESVKGESIMTDIEKRCHDLAVAYAAYASSREEYLLKEPEFLDLYASAYSVFSDEIRTVMDVSDGSNRN